ncbi:MAG TPA: bacterial transcriptional activator domain-containing protein, partial [Tepidiformaceae bacterium]
KLATDRRDPTLAISFHEAILNRDPLDEEVVREVMRCYASMGNINAVKLTYKRLIASLRRELQDDKAVPMRETTTVFMELTKQGAFAR